MQEPNATRGFCYEFNPWPVQVRFVFDDLTFEKDFLVRLPFPLSVALHLRAILICPSPTQSQVPEYQYVTYQRCSHFCTLLIYKIRGDDNFRPDVKQLALCASQQPRQAQPSAGYRRKTAEWLCELSWAGVWGQQLCT